MVSTVLQAFAQFSKNLELIISEKNSVIRSHQNIQTIIKGITAPNIIDTLLHGSWKRNTALRPINDVDIFAILDPTKISESWWFEGLNDAINPKYALDQIRKEMSNKFSQSSIRRDRPCVVIEFKHVKFDIMPVYRSSEGFYMPNSELDKWVKTNPDEFAAQLSEGNSLNNMKLVPLIKMMKHWRNNAFPNIISFDLEKILLDLFTSDYYFTQSPRVEQFPYAVLQSLERIKDSFQFDEIEMMKMDLSISNAKVANKLWEEGDDYDANYYFKQLFGSPFPK